MRTITKFCLLQSIVSIWQGTTKHVEARHLKWGRMWGVKSVLLSDAGSWFLKFHQYFMCIQQIVLFAGILSKFVELLVPKLELCFRSLQFPIPSPGKRGGWFRPGKTNRESFSHLLSWILQLKLYCAYSQSSSRWPHQRWDLKVCYDDDDLTHGWHVIILVQLKGK